VIPPFRPALLALEDGAVWHGRASGSSGTVTGEVCFNTSMTGYQEVLTDPSYHGQIVAMTAPEIGNTGVNESDDQAAAPWVSGLVTRDLTDTPSSWRASGSLEGYLVEHGVVGITDVDTRRLTRHIRTQGALRGAISSDVLEPNELVDVARSSPGLLGADLVSAVTTATRYRRAAGEVHDVRPGPADAPFSDTTMKVAAFDFGLKRNMLELLLQSGCDVDVLPARTTAAEVLAGEFDGVFLSNGPGDPEPLDYAVATARELFGKLPIFGICLGHQVLARALGAETFKLPFGHRGANHPVRRISSGAVEITCQNHGFAVSEPSLKGTEAHLTHVNLNDHTVEGIEVPDTAFSVQYHPEAAPGPHDSRYLFTGFRRLMAAFEPRDVQLEVPA
jgi:carbamoyl-phosphate synthase small subunit